MKIREHIAAGTIKALETRLEGLRNLNAPEVVLSSTMKAIEKAKIGEIGVKDKDNLLDIEVENFESKTGRGGKQFISYNNGMILYFPAAKFGKFITLAKGNKE